MKSATHPAYTMVEARCACGAVHSIRSTASSLLVELCSQRHPFYTGQKRHLDLTGRLEKFNNKYAKAPPPHRTKQT